MTEKKTIRDLAVRSIRRYPTSIASGVVDGKSWRFEDFGNAILALAEQFRKKGIGVGDRIALLGENQPSWALAYLAATSFGAIVVPILPDFSAADVLSILDHSEAKLLFVSRKQQEKLTHSAAEAPVEMVVLDDLLDTYAGEGGPGPETVAESIESLPAPAPDDTAAIIYTSGTTGHSKGVELSHWNIVSNVESADFFAHMTEGERMLSILPLAHTYECTLGMLIPFSCGASVHYLDRLPSPTVLMKALQTVKPNLMLSVPLLIEKIVRARIIPQLEKNPVRLLRQLPILGTVINKKAGKKLVDAFGGQLRFFGIGGAPLAPDVEIVLFKLDFPYAIGYGLTETAPLLAGTSPHGNTLRSTGIPTPGVEIRLQEGEIQARGPNIMKGYYRDPDRTAEVFTEDGWFRTGDLGEIDAQGRIYVKGRSKSVILGSNGENIYPEAIESVINQFEGVEESLVIQDGSRLIARVKLDYEHLADGARSLADSAVKKAGAAVGAAADAAGQAADSAREYLDDLRKRVNERLSSFSRISDIEEQEEPFVKTPTSKIKRYLYQNKEHPPEKDDNDSSKS